MTNAGFRNCTGVILVRYTQVRGIVLVFADRRYAVPYLRFAPTGKPATKFTEDMYRPITATKYCITPRITVDAMTSEALKVGRGRLVQF